MMYREERREEERRKHSRVNRGRGDDDPEVGSLSADSRGSVRDIHALASTARASFMTNAISRVQEDVCPNFLRIPRSRSV